jgi:hypothetical protein
VNSNPPTGRARNFMHVFGGIILLGVALYYIFWAVNSLGLEDRSALATVTGKEYHGPGTSYQAQNIGGRNFVRSLRTPEAYVVQLKLNDEETFAAVQKGLYDALNTNDQVQATYQRRRITGGLQVRQVTPAPKGGNP